MENADYIEFESFKGDNIEEEFDKLKNIIEEETRKISDTNKILPKEIRVIFKDYPSEDAIGKINTQYTNLVIQFAEWSQLFQKQIDEMWKKVDRKIEENSEEHLTELENKIKELEAQIEQLSAEKVGLNKEIERLKIENLNIKSKSLLAFFRRRDEESANDGI